MAWHACPSSCHYSSLPKMQLTHRALEFPKFVGVSGKQKANTEENTFAIQTLKESSSSREQMRTGSFNTVPYTAA